MYNRKYSYDSLRQSLRNLSESIPKQNNIFNKSADENTLGVFKKYIELDKQKELAGNAIYKQFTDLREDYTNGSINLKRYTDLLTSFKSFFEGDVIKHDLPVLLQAEEILQEIQKYI